MKAILHIGAEKTGSTSIQSALTQNRRLLEAEGLLYSRLCDDSGRHDVLPYIAGDPQTVGGLQQASAMWGSIENAKKSIDAEIEQEIKGTRCSSVVFSSEHCHSLLFTTDNVRSLYELMRRHFDSITVLIYVRRQDRAAISHYSTYLRMGGFNENPFSSMCVSTLRYDEVVNRWAEVFGITNIAVALYDSIVQSGASVVDHFIRYVGLQGVRFDVRDNTALSSIEQKLMRLINARMGPFDGSTIRSAISLVSDRQHRLPVSTKTKAMLFLEQFCNNNNSLCRDFFPERDALFDNDFSEYADAESNYNEELLALAVEALAEGGRLISNLEQRTRTLECALVERRPEEKLKRVLPHAHGAASPLSGSDVTAL